MEDEQIVDLYFNRSEEAVKETANKYGKFCYYIAYNILFSSLDAEECVSDTYLNVWNSIPPKKPEKLKFYVGNICRNVSLNRYDYNKAKKRNENLKSTIDEFCEIGDESSMNFDDKILLSDCIEKFLSNLQKKNRIIFIQRYWYNLSIKEISEKMKLKETNVKVLLHRARIKLAELLKKEGVIYD